MSARITAKGGVVMVLHHPNSQSLISQAGRGVRGGGGSLPVRRVSANWWLEVVITGDGQHHYRIRFVPLYTPAACVFYTTILPP